MVHAIRINWIIFDAVGTLIYPTPGVGEAYWRVGQRFGSRLSAAEVDERFHREFNRSFSRDRAADFVSTEQIERARWQQIVERVLDDVNDPEQCFAAVYRHFAQPAAWKLFDDVPAIQRQLQRAGFRLAIASNFDHRLHDVTRGNDVLNRFDAVLTSAELGFRKPSTQFFEELGRRLNAAPYEMLMVGDHPVDDVAAARSAGLKAVLIDRGHQYEHETGRITSLARLMEQIPDSGLT
jgi:putative hydrolase of the HAD superfamily